MKATFSEQITATDWINLLISKAPELRKAGVLELSPDRVVFAPYREESPHQDDTPAEEVPESVNPWTDALGMGFEPGTVVPSFRRQVTEDDDAQ